MTIKTKTVVIDGKKYLEKSFKKVVPVSDYGIYKVKGSQIKSEANLNVQFTIDDAADYMMLKGYLNNKLVPGTDEPAKDSYGDIPTGDNVYNIDRLKNNPVALVNHMNDASGIAGNYIYLSEDEQGLMFKLVLRPIDEVYKDDTKDTISAWSNGWGKAFSIGGQWLYDFENSNTDNNEYLLVKAILHEASLVAIGADEYALSSVPGASKQDDKGKRISDLTLAESVSKYLETEDDDYLKHIEKLKTKEGK